MKKLGRKSKPYRTTWGQTIDGLYRRPDGRWRIVETGYEFREDDERIAVARFRQWQHQHGKGEISLPLLPRNICDAMEQLQQYPSSKIEIVPDDLSMSLPIPEAALWAWVREQLIKRPEIVADRTGIPQVANLAQLPLPRPSVSIKELIKGYKDHAQSKDRTKTKAEKTMNELVGSTGAKTLRELTTDKLLVWADDIRLRYSSADTVATIFQRVRSVISFGLKRGFDEAEISAALNRCKVLVAPKKKQKYSAQAISREDFHRLLDKANDLEKAVLLFCLNCCMYGSEALAAEWNEIDFDAGTYLSEYGRAKTGIIRAATLWPETIAALKKLKRIDGAIFRSSRGDRYHPHSLAKVFAALRKRAELPATVKLNHLRDGAYTAACCNDVEFHLVKIVAGHKVGDISDKYIARNPGMVRPCCDKVWQVYFGEEKVLKMAS